MLVGVRVVGLFVGARVVGDFVGLEVGLSVGFRVVGLAVVGLVLGTLVGLSVVGILVGFTVGVGLLVVGEVVGGEHSTISIGGMHALLTQLFWVQTMPSLQPESLMQGSSASEFCAKHYIQGMSYYWWLQWQQFGILHVPNKTHPQGT